MKIPPPLPDREGLQILKYCFWLAFSLIIAMFLLTLQGREYPAFFEITGATIIGAIVGALKLQSNSH